MQRRRNAGRDPAAKAKPPGNEQYTATWLDSLPAPEVREGGESTWELWHEAERQLDAAFAPTEPSGHAPLSVGTGADAARVGRTAANELSADTLMVVARWNNRVCPRPELWTELYHRLGGTSYVDLPPPPVDRWIWTKLSALQKRLCLRETIEWAERHGKLPQVAKFMESLAEVDWLHMGET